MSYALKVCIGYDPRQSIAFSCLAHSIIRHASVPVAIIPMVIDTLPVPKEMVGLTPFTFTRYLTPHVCGFDGLAIFLDADIVVTGDIAELALCAKDPLKAVYVVKHEAKFEWPSVMVFNCEHEANKLLCPKYIADNYKTLPGFSWLGGRDSDAIGELPHEWNHLVLYDPPNPDAKGIHFTAGVPVWPETQGVEHHEAWAREMQAAVHAESFQSIMGPSRHLPVVKDHLIALGKLQPNERDDGSALP